MFLGSNADRLCSLTWGTHELPSLVKGTLIPDHKFRFFILAFTAVPWAVLSPFAKEFQVRVITIFPTLRNNSTIMKKKNFPWYMLRSAESVNPFPQTQIRKESALIVLLNREVPMLLAQQGHGAFAGVPWP